MIKKLLISRKIKRIQEQYSLVYDKWEAHEDESARGLLRCDLQDLAHAYDMLASTPVSPIPGLSSKFMSDDKENHVKNPKEIKLFNLYRSRLAFIDLYDKAEKQPIDGFGNHLRLLYIKTAHRLEEDYKTSLAQRLLDAGCVSDIDLSKFNDVGKLDNYVEQVLVLNRFKWKPVLC